MQPAIHTISELPHLVQCKLSIHWFLLGLLPAAVMKNYSRSYGYARNFSFSQRAKYRRKNLTQLSLHCTSLELNDYPSINIRAVSFNFCELADDGGVFTVSDEHRLHLFLSFR